MAHLIFEYTNNLAREAADIPGLLRKSNHFLLELGVFPPGGIRSRAIGLQDYCVAEGDHDDAFVHATVKMGAGRKPETVRRTAEGLFEVMKDHFSDIFQRRTLALSLELIEFPEGGTLKHNNIHARYAKN